MVEQNPKEEVLSIIKEIEADPATTQRDLSRKLDMSLGKVNYLHKELIKIGLIEARNFSNLPHKLQKIYYILTPKGFEHKVELTHHFLIQKEIEYNDMKKEWDELQNNKAGIK